MGTDARTLVAPPTARSTSPGLARNDAVVAARARSLTWQTIAQRFGLEERQCRRIVDEYRSDRPLPYGSKPMTVIRETLETYDAMAEGRAPVAASRPGSSDRPRGPRPCRGRDDRRPIQHIALCADISHRRRTFGVVPLLPTVVALM
jgi:hypothetical protein